MNPTSLIHQNQLQPQSGHTFSAKEKDDETGYSYFGARYYDSELSVWLSVDPMADKYPSQSPYSYVGNRPINTIDPWGLDEIKDPNGHDGNAGDGYKQTSDKKYLYGDGLQTKVWNPDLEYSNTENGGNLASSSTKGGYENYTGDAIDFENYRTKSNTSECGNDALYFIGMGLNVAGFSSGFGEYSNTINGQWRGINGKWNSMKWGGNKWTGARSSALSNAKYFKLASRGLFIIGTGISLYQGGEALLNGNYAAASKSGLDIGMGAFATFGGPAGWLIGGGYFALDAFGAFSAPMTPSQRTPPSYPVIDNTYVAPFRIKPLQ